ncbi:MAG: hypothetical protein GF418_07915 [Chitinivibrionales bacterium]|nr:hypothetical protein [Chitinivibrionales bacterium]MBD3395538.1 hypothetical protein [Chitinivibrionales bacterium]
MKRLVLFSGLISLMYAGGCILDWKDDTWAEDDTSTVESARYLIVATSDYASGNVAQVNVEDFSVSADLLSIHSDAVVSTRSGTTYILERGGADNLIRVDGDSISSSRLVYQQSIGTAVNVQDIAVVNGSKAYVTQYASPDLVIADPSTGEVTGSVSLDSALYLNDDETVPYMSAAMAIGGNVYVAIQRLKVVQGPFGPAPDVVDSTGMIVVISTATDKIVASIKLSKGNPASMDTCGGYLYVSSTGSWSDAEDGGIERIDVSTNMREGLVISERKLGGNITKVVMVSGTKGYVAVAQADFTTRVVEFDPSEGTKEGTISGIDDAFGGIAYDGTYLYVGDRSLSDPGVIVIDPSDNSTVAGPIDVGSLPPFDLAVLTIVERT